jgi:hypothetical protein
MDENKIEERDRKVIEGLHIARSKLSYRKKQFDLSSQADTAKKNQRSRLLRTLFFLLVLIMTIVIVALY